MTGPDEPSIGYPVLTSPRSEDTGSQHGVLAEGAALVREPALWSAVLTIRFALREAHVAIRMM
jgi:hypothetical protein